MEARRSNPVEKNHEHLLKPNHEVIFQRDDFREYTVGFIAFPDSLEGKIRPEAILNTPVSDMNVPYIQNKNIHRSDSFQKFWRKQYSSKDENHMSF